MIRNLISGRTNIFGFATGLIALISAVTVHEWAHAWAAWKLGDPTAKLKGRLTLNPKAHFDTLGTLFLVITGFGWGKPVPINPLNLMDPLKDTALISLAGPVSNLLLAICAALLTKLYSSMLPLLLPVIILNLNFGIFNLLPIAPLDGFKIVSGALPKKLVPEWEKLRSYGFLILIMILFPFGKNSLLESALSPIFRLLISNIL